jgi:hypothetical protein
MNDQDMHDDLTPEERQAFAALSRQRIPPAALEERVVGALRAEGLLSQDTRRTAGASGVRPWWTAAAVAAGVALFASGVAVGQWRAGGPTPDVVSTAVDRGADPEQAATQVQEAGSEYVRAVAHLAELAGRDGAGELASGAEAARVALHAAALELARVRPDDPTLRLVLAVLEERADAAADSTPGPARKTIWF